MSSKQNVSADALHLYHRHKWISLLQPCTVLFLCSDLLYTVTDADVSKWYRTILMKLSLLRIVPGCVLAGRSLARARAAMPFGCLTLGEKKDYNNPSEVTDKYDLGQIVKSWVHPVHDVDKCVTTTNNVCSEKHHMNFVASTERSFVRYSGRRIGTPWKCTPVKSSTKRMGGKWGKLRRMRSWS